MDKFIPIYQPDLSGNELKYVTDCVTSGWISSLGDYVGRFEKKFAEFCEVEHAIALANGTVAIHLGLLLKDIGHGDEVLVPTLTFVATANAIRYTGAKPVFIDSEPETWTIDTSLIEAAITERTKAIIPVHLYGHPVDMDPIMDIAERYNLFIIEDAAEAHGAEYKNRRVGSIGDVGTFSFYGNKVITTGEGGMITTNDPKLAEKARLLKDHGMSSEIRYWHPVIGYNYRLTNIQAAIGFAQLERIDSFLARKREIANLYNEYLEVCSSIRRPPQAPWAVSTYWMYSILLDENTTITRDELILELRKRGIDSRPFFHPVHTFPPYQDEKSFPVAVDLASRGLNLPSYPTLSDSDITKICEEICELCER